MPKCCFPSCDTGTFVEAKRTKAAGLRARSFFRFPKDAELLKKWNKVIFDNEEKIIDKQRICELHFKESDIIKYDETILKDGTIHRLPRSRYIVRSGACPTLSNEEEKESTDVIKRPKILVLQNQLLTSVDNKVNHEVVQVDNKFLLPQTFQLVTQYSQSNNDNPEPQISDHSKNKTKAKVYNRISNRKCKVSSSKNELPATDYQENLVTVESDLCAEPNDNILINQDIEENNHQNENMIQEQTNTNTLIEKITSYKENNKNQDRLQDYNFSQLRNDLETKSLNISSSWSYIFQENASVTFVYVHPLKFTVQLLCIIDCNMNVKIATFDKRVSVDINIKFKTGTDLVNYFSTLEKTKCCEGTGIKDSYSKECIGFISSNEEYKRSRGYQRCGACREFRKTIMRSATDPVNIEVQMKEQNRKIKSLQYKYATLQKLLLKKKSGTET